ncbi:MAG TPA: hypothetical protein VGA72_14235 [Anaerolineales bacterium]
MTTSNSAFVGVHLSYGRKPFTLALLDDDLDLITRTIREIKDISEVLSELDPATVCVTANSKPKSAKSVNTNAMFYEQLENLSFRPYPSQNETRQWFKADANEAFSALLQKKLLSRRTLEGRIQRALVLYDRGLQIRDPMEFFEEITRYKLIQGILPLEILYTPKELDALVAAYVAWMTVNRPGQIERFPDNMVQPKEQIEA